MAAFNFNQNFAVGTVAGAKFTGQSLVMNPTLMLEELGTFTGHGRVEGALQAMRGVHIGGIVYTSWFGVLQPGGGSLSNYLIDYITCQEALLTQAVDDQGFPASFPEFGLTWRPISGSDNDDTPKDNSGQLVRVHKRKLAVLASGDNAYGFAESAEALGSGSTQSNTTGLVGWGPTSLHLKRFISDDQQLVFQLDVQSSTAETNDRVITWLCHGQIYYRLGWK